MSKSGRSVTAGTCAVERGDNAAGRNESRRDTEAGAGKAADPAKPDDAPAETGKTPGLPQAHRRSY